MSTGTLRDTVEGIEYDLPDVPDTGRYTVGTSATEEGVLVLADGVLLTPDEARRLAGYLHEAAAWVEAVRD